MPNNIRLLSRLVIFGIFLVIGFFSYSRVVSHECVNNVSTCPRIVFVMGPSCSGKSTLAEALVEHLGNNWVLVSFDTLEDKLGRTIGAEAIFISMIDEINALLKSAKNVVIDTNTFYLSHCNRLSSMYINYVLMSTPLEVLFERDAIRAKRLRRAPKQAQRARDFVEKSFHRFRSDEIMALKLHIIDTSRVSPNAAVAQAITVLGK